MNVGRPAVGTLSIMLAARMLAAQQTSDVAGPLSRFAERKAETLLREKLPCLGCHQMGHEGGRLAPDLATVRERRSPAFIAAIVADPQRVRPGTMMPRHPQPAAQEQLIVRYLTTRAGAATGGVDATPAQHEDRSAAALYSRFCAGCHGANGGGDGPNAKSLPVTPAVHRSGERMSLRSDDALFDAISGGGAIMNRSPRMPAFSLVLAPAEIRSLVRHIRELCKCQGPAWSTDGSRR
ncbi:MAG: c-type cytochrome [Gemmatimonadaceae bacterium]